MKFPDWKDRDNYPDPKTATPQEWAWQFLRRNIEYQNAYANLNKLKLDTEPHHKKMLEEAERKWNKLKEENPGKFIKRILVSNKPVEKLESEIRTQFNLATNPLDPFENRPLNIQEIFPSNQAIVHIEAEFEWVGENTNHAQKEISDVMRETTDSSYFQPDYIDHFHNYLENKIHNRDFEKVLINTKQSELTFSIDLRGNTNIQIEKIKKFISDIRKEIKKRNLISDYNFRPETFLFYLQFHDAILSGVKYKEIAMSLKKIDDYNFNAKEKMKKWRQKKDQIVKYDYIKIAYLPTDWLNIRQPTDFNYQ